jgi:large subunit ribosomal protein L23
MKLSEVLVRPVITEKVNGQMERSGRYTFVVGHQANKLEIKKAVESFYGVRVSNVNTIVVPAKNKSRFTKAGLLTGRKPSYKKAVVTLAEGETPIDFFGGNN